jgi:DNA repair ATPase RecN
MGMIDVTGDFQSAVDAACREKKIRSGIITGFTTGGVAALTTLEFEPGLVRHDVREAMQGIAGLDARFARIAEELKGIYYSVQQVDAELQSLNEELSFDPALMDKIAARLDAISRLERKYGAT